MKDRRHLPGRLGATRLPAACLVAAGLLAACGGSSQATPGSSEPGPEPITFVYLIGESGSDLAHTTHLQLLDSRNGLLLETTLKTAGTVDTGTMSLKPGSYSAVVWDEQPASPNPVISTKCGAPFTVDAGQPLVVTITNSRLGACLTDTSEPNASPTPVDASPGASGSPGPP